MDSKLNPAIMLRSKLRNKFLKSRSNKDIETYKKQQNLCVSLLRQNKKQSVTKIMGKTAIWKIYYFYPLPPLNNVVKQ